MSTPTTTADAEPEPASGTDATPAIDVRELTHQYPSAKKRSRNGAGTDKGEAASAALALDHVSFSVAPGEVFGFLGPNGSGKTTLFRTLATMLRPTSGKAMIVGDDVLATPDLVRRHLGVVFQSPSLDGKLTARENMVHQGHLYGLSGADLNKRIDRLLAVFSLDARSHDFAERFSGGMKRRLELAKALLHEPRVLLLDEPSTGLDAGARADLWKHLENLRQERGITIALTTHMMDEAERCDRLAVMHHGKIAAIQTPHALKSMIGKQVVWVDANGSITHSSTRISVHVLADRLKSRFGPWPVGGEPTVIRGRIRFEKDDAPAMVSRVYEEMRDQIDTLSIGTPTLEDAYLHLTGHTLYE
ncbi:MAG: ATP-binding cassette domain-containing protein [Phycisphaera sp.]|nr:ATP-binding cassette domain-containing protein [Phycisphaera sp.]